MRTFEEIDKEYANVCLNIGHSQRLKKGLEEEIKKMLLRAEELSAEGIQAKASEEKANAKSETDSNSSN